MYVLLYYINIPNIDVCNICKVISINLISSWVGTR